MANSIAYVLSKNTYPTSTEAQNVGIFQGTRVVYTTTSTLTTANVLYADSRLTQPLYGDGESWYAVQLLTDTSVNYEITINENAVIDISVPVPVSTLYLSSLSSGDACAQTGTIYPITGITYNTGTSLCDSVSMTSDDILGLSGNTTYYISDGGTNVREGFKAGGAGVTLITFTAPCTSC